MSAVRDIEIGGLTACYEMRSDGALLASVDQPLQPYPPTLIERLQTWVNEKPDHLFLAKRCASNPAQWLSLTYGEMWQKIQHVGSALIARNLNADRPIAILSGNDLEHAILALSAIYAGIPYAVISPQYSLISSDFSKLKYCLDLITPGMVFVDDAALYANPLLTTVADDVELVAVNHQLPNRPTTRFEDLLTTPVTSELARVHQNIGLDDIAKFLFSSGSTGMPKAIINTHRMLCANQQMILQALPFLREPPVLVDWLPWNHTFGGNHNFGITLYNGGTLYIDDGKPTPKGFLESVRNLKEIAPTAFYNVPKGFEELVKHLKADNQLREMFFSRVKMLFYAGAGLSQPVWDALEELAIATCGERIMIVTGLGCTETAPSALFTTGDGGFAGWLGLPVPGITAKLVPVGTKTEIRIKGDSVTPGYWRQPELTRKAFDDEGFFCTGDAVKFVDENNRQKGFQFDGRISEDFKLDTGTWVSAGPLRAKFLNHFGASVKDVVLVGRDRPYISALVFPDFDVCRSLDACLTSLNDAELCAHPLVKKYFQAYLHAFAEQASGSSNRITKLALQVTPPDIDAHEITDKGSLNASAIQDNRHAEIAALYDEEGSDTTARFIALTT